MAMTPIMSNPDTCSTYPYDDRHKRIRVAQEALASRGHEEVALKVAAHLVSYSCADLRRIERRVRELLGVSE